MSFELPPPPRPNGNYSPVVIHNGIAYVSGQVSREGTNALTGYLSKDDDIGPARKAAEVAVLRCLSALADAAGGLDRIERILMLRGFIRSAPDFERHAAVMDAASDVLQELLGERGDHARIALGAGSIPSQGLVEVEMVAAVRS